MQKSDFDKLLERYLAGNVTEQERIKLEAWLDVMKTEDTSGLELSKEVEDKLFQKITDNVDNVEEIVAITGRKTPVSPRVLRIAAILAIVSVVSYGGWYFSHTPDQRTLASKGAVEKLILNDGSIAWLRGESRLVYYEKPAGGIRYAEFNGEALFEVAKDAEHPFVIRCGEATLRVIGTSFSVKAGSDSVVLKVLTGRVNFSSGGNQAGVEVEPNEELVYRKDGATKKIAMDRKEVPALTANTQYDMLFTNATLDEVMRGIAGKFDVAIELADKQAGKCRITADFTDHSLESTLQMIKEVLDVEYAKSGKVIKINGSGCN